MVLTVHPDPQNPAGGYAFLELPGGTLPDEPVEVAVFDRFGERWLGPEGADTSDWQTEPNAFGPYPVHRHEGADWVRVGPEIVDRLVEYSPLRIKVHGKGYDVTWPDDVPPRVSPATRGALHAATPARPVPSEPAPSPAMPPEPVPEAPPERDSGEDPHDRPDPTSRHGRLWVLLLAVLIACAVAVWWFWPAGQDRSAGRDCSAPALAAVEGGFAETGKAIRSCVGQVSAETVLALVEDAAAKEDPDALHLFGVLYDGAELDQTIETGIGLSFEHDAAKAAEYYARAIAAGSDESKARLRATCAQLAASDATLAMGAFNDFCQ